MPIPLTRASSLMPRKLMGNLESARTKSAPGRSVMQNLCAASTLFTRQRFRPFSTKSDTQLLTDAVESNKTSSEIIAGSRVLGNLFQPKAPPVATSAPPEINQAPTHGFVLVGEPYTKRPFLSKLPRLEKYTEEAALARLKNSPWQGKFSQVKIARDGTCFYGSPRHSNFFERVYPLMVTTEGVCVEPQPGMTVLLLGSWNDLSANTSVKTIVHELGPKHKTYIRNIDGEINPFSFSKTEEQLASATDADRFDHLTRAYERNEPIYMVTPFEP